MIIMKKRTFSEILPERVTKFWDEWQLRVFVLVSLFLQIVLVLLGNRRRYIPGNLLRFILWLAYSPADRIAEISFGILSNYLGDGEDNPSQQIQAFWAPFLLLHLGGPDSITAYSLEDNALWRRHFLGLLMHSGGAVYIFLRSWKGTPLNILSILMYVAGLIKYGERSWYLMSRSTNHFRKSMIRWLSDEGASGEGDTGEGPSDEGACDGGPSDGGPSDEGPSDGEPSDEGPSDGEPSDERPSDEEPSDEEPNFEGPSDEGLRPSYAPCGCASSRCCVPCQPGSEMRDVVILSYAPCRCASSRCCVPCQPGSEEPEVVISVNMPSPSPRDKSNPLQTADKFFPRFKLLFTDLVLKWTDLKESKSFFEKLSSEEAFEVTDIELGFAYDMFYTKAMAADRIWGGLRRFICLCYIISTFMGFLIIDKHGYSTSDVIITLLLLVGAILLEIYSIILLCSSERTMSWLSKREKTRLNVICEAISSCRVPFLFPANKRWSDSMAQYSLISYSLKNLPIKCSEDWNICISDDWNFCISPMVEKFSEVWNCISQMLEECYSNNLKVVPKKLKTLIFEQLREKSWSASDIKAAKKLCAHRGQWTLKKMNCFCRFGWSIGKEFDESILLWHVATEICYYTENSIPVKNSNRDVSKQLSDYMLHLLVKRPLMLPNGIGQIRFQDSCAEAIEFFGCGKHVKGKTQACEKLLQMYTENQLLKVKGYRSKSLLSDASKLAKSLQSLETKKEWGYEKKWEMMSHVWVEMLFYAACHCPRNHHVNELRLGGELLTHVWFLMAQFGITEHLCEG